MFRLLKQIILKFALIWGRQVIWTVCLVFGLLLLLLFFALPDVLFMSERALLENLANHYEREFTVLDARSLGEEERAADVYRLKVFELTPVDEPGRHFWAFNVVSGERGGVFGFSNGLLDTYDEEIVLTAFAERAAQAGLAYDLTYDGYPCRTADKYYSGFDVNIELAGVTDLPAVCELINLSFKDALALLPADYDYHIGVDFVFIYREAAWPEDKFYPLRIEPFDNWADGKLMSATDMQSEINSELQWYQENYDVWKNLQNKN